MLAAEIVFDAKQGTTFESARAPSCGE